MCGFGLAVGFLLPFLSHFLLFSNSFLSLDCLDSIAHDLLLAIALKSKQIDVSWLYHLEIQNPFNSTSNIRSTQNITEPSQGASVSIQAVHHGGPSNISIS